MGRRYNRIKILVKEDRTPYTGKRDLSGGWRKKILSESDWTPVAGSIANSTSTTFISTIDNSTLLHVTGLGGVEGTPKTATIDFGFGDTLEVPAPAFNLLGLQGYAPPLANIQRKTDQKEDERIDAEIRKLEEQIKQITEQQNGLFEVEKSTEPEYTGWSEAEYTDKVNEINGRYSDILAPYFKNMTGKFGTGFGSASPAERKRAYAKAAELEPAQTAELNNLAAEYKRQTDAFVKERDAHRAAYDKRNRTLEAQKDVLNIQIVKLEKQRPINKQLDASQEAYPYVPLMNARVQSAAGSRQYGYNYSYKDGAPGAGGAPIMDIAMGLKAFGSDNVAAQQAYPTTVRTGQGGRSLGSTTQRQGGAINPSTPAPSATGMSFSDLANVVNQYSQYNQYSQDNLAKNDVPPKMNARVQPSPAPGDYRNNTPSNFDRVRDTVLDTLASVADLDTAKNALRSYNDFLANPKGAGSSPNNPLDISNQVSDRDMSALRDAANSGGVRSAIEFAKQKNTSLAWNTAADTLEARLNVVTTQTPGLNNTVKGTGTLDRERFIQSNGEDIRLNKTYAFRPGGSIANLEKSLLGKGLSALGIKLDTLGAGGISNIAGPLASSAMLTNLKGDLYNAPAANMQIKVDMSRQLNTSTPVSGRGAGRSSFPTSDGNVVPRSNSANANSVGQRGSDGGMTDAQIKAAQDKANAARRAGKMSDIRGSQANKGFAPDPKTGEPRYTGMNDQQYGDAYNKIADKYNKLREPIQRQYAKYDVGGEYSGQVAPMSLMNKFNALNDAQTAEEEALAAKREAQENAFNDALQDYNDKQDAANQARQDALDEIDNEEDPYSKLLAELGAKMEKLRREGKAIKREEIIGPGEEGYVDTTNMANAIGYNRRIIYTAAAQELQKQILAAQDAQMKWLNDRDKRREDAEKADYSDAGGSSGQGRRKGGQGGLPLGTTTLRSGGARQGVAPEDKSQSADLARQAAFARANRQQRRKNNKKYSTFSTESTTWDRIQKYR